MVLRAFVPCDLPALAALRNDVDLQERLMARPTVQSDAQVRAWVERRAGDPDGIFRVIDDGEGAVGFVQLVSIDWESGVGTLGIAVARACWGRGHARSALRELAALARAEGLRKIVLQVRADNAAAAGLYRGLGFVEVGRYRRHWTLRGVEHDVLAMEWLLDEAVTDARATERYSARSGW